MHKIKSLILIISLLLTSAIHAQDWNKTAQEGIKLLKQGSTVKAITYLTEQLTINKNDNQSRIILSHAYDFNGEPELAIKSLNEGLIANEADLDLLWRLGEFHNRMAKDGPTVSYKNGTVSYSPSKDKVAENEYKKKHLKEAINCYENALKIKPNTISFVFQLASTLALDKQNNKAIKLLETLTQSVTDEPKFFIKLADVYLETESLKKAQTSLENALILNPRSGEINIKLAQVFKAQGDNKLAGNHQKIGEFYSWVPEFIQLDFTEENYQRYLITARVNKKDSQDSTKYENDRVTFIQKLAEDKTVDSLAFLAALCSKHSDHGAVESIGFKALEDNPKIGLSHLLNLLNYHTSICTARQAAEGLAKLKATEAVDRLIQLVPHDTRPLWTINVAECLAQINEKKAIPALLEFANISHTQEFPEDDPMNMSSGLLFARYRSIFALGAFKSEQTEIQKELTKGLDNPQTSNACLLALYRLTQNEKFLNELKTTIATDEHKSYLTWTLDLCKDPTFQKLSKDLEKITNKK